MKEMTTMETPTPARPTPAPPASNSAPSAPPEPLEPPAPMADKVRSEERVSVTFGDRLCVKCHYNLIGQPVLREPHYNMLIVRCPECGTVASMQEYPQLGRWAQRWAVALSALCVLIILGVTAATTPAVIASMFEFGDLGAQPYRHALEDHWEVWYEAEYEKTPGASRWNPDKFDEWMEANPPEQILADMGGFWTVIRTPDILFYIIPMGIAFVYGAFIAVALVHRRRQTLAMLSVGLLILGGCLFATIWYQIATYDEINSFRNLAEHQVFFPLSGMGYVGLWIMLLVGAMFGRPIVRGLVKILLPPNMRGSLGVLWTTDGLVPPTPGALNT